MKFEREIKILLFSVLLNLAISGKSNSKRLPFYNKTRRETRVFVSSNLFPCKMGDDNVNRGKIPTFNFNFNALPNRNVFPLSSLLFSASGFQQENAQNPNFLFSCPIIFDIFFALFLLLVISILWNSVSAAARLMLPSSATASTPWSFPRPNVRHESELRCFVSVASMISNNLVTFLEFTRILECVFVVCLFCPPFFSPRIDEIRLFLIKN